MYSGRKWRCSGVSLTSLDTKESKVLAAISARGTEVITTLQMQDDFGRQLAEVFAQSVLAYASPIALGGFREVRYLEPKVPILEYLRFLQSFFPRAYFVFCLRAPEKILRTSWWRRRNNVEYVKKIEVAQTEFLTVAEQFPNNSFVAELDHMLADPACLRPLFERLELRFDLEKIQQFFECYDPDDAEAAF